MSSASSGKARGLESLRDRSRKTVTMAKRSAGILLFRRTDQLEVLLVHPGGPFWAKKDLGAWSIPKGEREFGEETGTMPEEGELDDLGSVRQKSGKVVQAFALEGDLDADMIRSNTFT